MSNEKTPLTLITGYLGAGKTSLLQHLLEKSNKKFAVLMNEFGELAVDGKIIEGKHVQMKELSGGCVCCSLTGEFELAVKEIIEKVKPEWILVETTGVAEPSALAFDIGKSLPEVRMDAIVTVVDADAFIRFPNLGHTGREQIEMADILLLNKIDLVDADAVIQADQHLRAINPRAILSKAIRGKIPPGFLFGLNKEQLFKFEAHRHVPDMEVFIYEGGSFSRKKFERFVKQLPKEIYRAKGFVQCGKSSYLFNSVAGRFELEPFQTEKTQLVFIGKDILKLEAEVKNKLEKCKVK